MVVRPSGAVLAENRMLRHSRGGGDGLEARLLSQILHFGQSVVKGSVAEYAQQRAPGAGAFDLGQPAGGQSRNPAFVTGQSDQRQVVGRQDDLRKVLLGACQVYGFGRAVPFRCEDIRGLLGSAGGAENNLHEIHGEIPL